MIVHKLATIPAPAAHVSLASSDPNTTIDQLAWKSLQLVIAQQFYSRVISEGSRFRFEFFNKTFTFQVTCVTAKDLGMDDSLEAQLDGLSLDDTQFYTITRGTAFKLDVSDTVEASSEANNSTNQVELNKIDLIGGLDPTVATLRELMGLAFGRVASMQGIQVSRSVLLFGLPGCGKTLLCEALAAESKALVIKLNASDIFSKYFGETEANLIGYFDRAFANYPKPTVIIIEEIVNVCAKETKEDSAKRVCSAFLNMLDALHNRKDGSRTLVLSTTSNIENISPAARRCGRIDVEIEIPVPNPGGREEILQKHLIRLRSEVTPEEVKHLANVCHGFVGADLASLVSKAVLHAINSANSSGAGDEGGPILRVSDLDVVLPLVKPSAMRELLIECPNIKWSDIGGQDELKLQLKQAIEWPLTNPEKFLRMGINPPRGILMFGPPGCSKTMIAKALATESKVNFLSIKGPELFSMWVGESERAVRELFRKARSVAPAIIFFDEIDAIGGERAAGGSSSVKERVLAQMLTEMDGVNALQNVTIVAATNRPDLIDKALMRPGRIDRIVYVRLPDVATRAEIFRIKMRKMPVDEDVDVDELVRRTDGYSGAEVQAVCQEAALKALEDDFEAETVKRKDFEKALQCVQPRSSEELLRRYDEYLKNF